MSSISSWSSINKKERKFSNDSSENRDKAEFQEFLGKFCYYKLFQKFPLKNRG